MTRAVAAVCLGFALGSLALAEPPALKDMPVPGWPRL
jgi:hypothetical protein